MSTAKRLGAKPAVSILAITTLVSTGCVAPGTAGGRIGLSGHIEAMHAPKSIDIMLPKTHGLAPMDLAFAPPEYFGNSDETVRVEVEENHFTQDFGRRGYHADVWIIPPLGAFPRRPPMPDYVLTFSGAEEYRYHVSFDEGKFRYRIMRGSKNEVIREDQAPWIIREGRRVRRKDDEGKIWYLHLAIARPAQL